MIEITVVVPTHRRPELLGQLLDSLDRQTYPAERFEVVIVATPGDEAFAVVAKRANPAVRCVSVPDDRWGGRNPSAKRNHGGQIARGEWLAFIDDDCVAEPDWLAAAARYFETAVALEGAKVIPPVDPPTLTYKGLRQFETPGGYQSCNMFYRRDLFLAVGGFDLRFPFYLEDTDLAWTVLDAGHAIPHVADARVRHPVPPAAPWRLLDDARRTDLLQLLARKHPARSGELRSLRGWHWAFLVLYAVAIGSALLGQWGIAFGAGLLVVLLTAAVAVKWFRGCRVGFKEFLVTAGLIPVVPVVRAIGAMRGRLRYRGSVSPNPPLKDLR
jgi:GT2 family glycosyltransferase